eukprot:52573-Eustigmatos_ZCMA.PRE.1
MSEAVAGVYKSPRPHVQAGREAERGWDGYGRTKPEPTTTSQLTVKMCVEGTDDDVVSYLLCAYVRPSP